MHNMSMNDYYSPKNVRRTIHTDLFSPKAKIILERARVYMDRNWGSLQMRANAGIARPEVQPNGEVTWVVYNECHDWRRSWKMFRYGYSTYSSRSEDAKVREWLAVILKEICFRQFRAEIAGHVKACLIKEDSKKVSACWKRTNNTPVKLLSDDVDCFDAAYHNEPITVADVYCLYDKLLNRKRFAKQWPKKIVKVLIGAERDPAATQLEIVRREELAKLKKKLDADLLQAEVDCDSFIREARKTAECNLKIKKEELNSKYLKDVAALEEDLSFITENDPVASALFG